VQVGGKIGLAMVCTSRHMNEKKGGRRSRWHIRSTVGYRWIWAPKVWEHYVVAKLASSVPLSEPDPI
jgi:hypothetical protein